MVKRIADIIKHGESETVEFKTSFGKDVIETAVAFANTRGGTILIGVSDDGEVVGTTCGSESLQIWANEIFEYPVSALRELLLNAVVHRDYTSPTDIQIKIFDNAITFFNRGW